MNRFLVFPISAVLLLWASSATAEFNQRHRPGPEAHVGIMRAVAGAYAQQGGIKDQTNVVRGDGPAAAINIGTSPGALRAPIVTRDITNVCLNCRR